MKKKSILKMIIPTLLIIYIIITILPLYFLFIRSFVSTADSTTLHLTIPPARELKMTMKYSAMLSYLSLDSRKFKQAMGIKGSIPLSLNLEEIAEQFNIPPEKIQRFLKPYYSYSGWISIFRDKLFPQSVYGTTFVTIVSILLTCFLSACTGSVLAGFRKKWHVYIYQIYLFQMVIPFVIVMIPLFLIITKYLHLMNSYWALILIYAQGGALSTMIYTSYIASFPVELSESVYLDGGNRIHYFFKILLPNTKVPFSAYSAISVPYMWNDLLNGMLYLKPEKMTFIPLINEFTGGRFTTNFQAIYAGLFISVLPLMILYLLFNKLFIRSMLSGAMKG